jgi:mono/diheme cytochrome c family protein
MEKTGRRLSLMVVLFSVFPAVATAQNGETIFGEKCVICHSAGVERIVGPGLAGVLDRRDREWVKAFIMRPDQMLAAGDSIAVALFTEYQIAMPNFAITESDAEALLTFFASAPAVSESASTPSAPAPPAPEATEDQIELGRDLFQGTVRLANGGPTCNSCHDVTGDAVIGGGVLAKELTTVFTRLGGPGVRAILGSPPFPVMQRAYQDKALMDEEVVALMGFLDRTSAEQSTHQPSDYGFKLLMVGILGSALLFGLFSLTWRGRIRGSVNQEIFDRQIKST